jgi:hypothetical protein
MEYTAAMKNEDWKILPDIFEMSLPIIPKKITGAKPKPVAAWGFINNGRLVPQAHPTRAEAKIMACMDEKIVQVTITRKVE